MPARRIPATFPAQRLAGHEYVEEHDETAAAAERKWGVGRLELLVSPELRIKWRRQQDRLNSAIESGDEEQIRLACQATVRGYAALDREAEARGHQPVELVQWEAETRDGPPLVIVRTTAEAFAAIQQAKAEGRKVQVWTVDELGRVMHHLNPVAAIKDAFPGAQVIPMTPRKGRGPQHDPGLDDEIPF